MGALERLARDVDYLKRAERARHGQLGAASLEDQAIEIHDADGATVGIVGRQPDGTYTAASTGGPTPPAPTAPGARAGAGVLTVSWDGGFLGADGQPDPMTVAPMDFSRVEVHVSRDGEAFEPTRETFKGTIESPRGGEYPHGPLYEAGEYWCRLVARSQSGKESPASPAVLVVVDVADVAVEMARLEEALAEADAALEQLRASMAELEGADLPELREALESAQERLAAAEQEIGDAFGQLGEIPGQIDQARQEAITAAAQDAEAKATAAREAAEAAAQQLVDAIESGASPEDIAALQEYADQAAAAAQAAAERAAQAAADAALEAAKRDATEKADAARQAAVQRAQEAQTAADQALSAAEQLALDVAGKSSIIVSATAPEPDGSVLWVDTTDGNRQKVWRDELGAGPRENWLRNPTGTGPLFVAAFSNNSAGETSVHEEDVRQWRRLTWTRSQASGTTLVNSGLNVHSAYAYPGRQIAGQSFSASVLMRTSRTASQMGLYLQFINAAGTNIGNNLVAQALEPDTWTRIEVNNRTAPEGTDTVRVLAYGIGPGQWQAGDTLDVAELLLEPASAAGPWFSGDSLGARWEGAPHSSASIYPGPDWVEVQDSRIAAALADAEQARAEANAAHEAAGSAAEAAAAAMDRAGAAGDAAEEARELADGLPKVLHGTTPPAGTAPDGSIWWEHAPVSGRPASDVSGPVIGQWARVAGSWVSTPVRSEAIANLDVGKLTAGAAEIAQVVAQRIAAATGQFLELDVGQLTVTGTSRLADVVAERIAGEIAQFLRLEVGQLIAGSGVLDEAVINRLFADVVVAGMAQAEAFIGENALLSGAVTAAKIHASEELTAKIAAFLRVQAEHMAADAIDGMTITGATVQTSHEHPKTMLDETGFHITDADGSDVVNLTGTPEETGGNYLGILAPDGSTLANISDEGMVSGQGLNIAADPEFQGLPLLGDLASWESPALNAPAGWLDMMPRGVVAWGQVNDIDGRGVTNGEMALMELSAELRANRRYMINVVPLGVRIAGGHRARMHVRYTTDGTQPRFGSSTLRQWPFTTYGLSNTHVDSMGGAFAYSPGGNWHVRFLLTVFCSGEAVVDPDWSQHASMWVEDIGPSVENTAVARSDRNSDPAPPSETIRNYTKRYWATGGRTYYTSGGWRNQNTQYVYQGQMPGMGGVRSAILFPNMTGDLSGAEITSMRAHVDFSHWYYSAGGDAQIQLHGLTSLPTSMPSMEHGWTEYRIPKPGSRTFGIPSRYWDRFKSGALRGIGLGDTSPSLAEYGYGHWDRAYIEVRYRK